MTITTKQAAARKMSASKTDYHSALETVSVTVKDGKSTVVATNSYMLMAITAPTDEPDGDAVYDVAEVDTQSKIAKALKDNHVQLDNPSKENFPKWESVKPDQSTMKSLRVNRKYLIQMLQAIDTPNIDLAIGDPQKPMTIQAQQ